MEGDPALLLDIVKRVSGFIVFLSTTKAGLSFVAAALAAACLAKVALSLRAASLAEAAAGRRLGAAGGFLAVLEALGSIAARLAASLPGLLIAAAVSLSLVAVGETASRLQAIADEAQRVKELRAVVRNLERSAKVADVRVLTQIGGRTRLAIDFYDPSAGNAPASSKEIEIAGRDIYFDAIVLNFAYSEIEQGRATNIAVPYRVFSDEVAQADGVPLGASDEAGVPYAFRRADGDVYGIAPAVYRARLAELMSLAASEEEARKEGVVRSLYGSALHKKVKPGDRLELRVEQSGGLTLRDKPVF